MATAIVVTSGKGGTGKTSLTGGVASCLAALGNRVLCIDMDVGLRNLDLSLGLSDRALMDFTDVLEGRCSLERAAVPHPVIADLCLLTAPVKPPVRAVDPEEMRALLTLSQAPMELTAFSTSRMRRIPAAPSRIAVYRPLLIGWV